jgi:hypothetical protein
MRGGTKAHAVTRRGSWAGLGVSTLAALLVGPLAATAGATFSAPVELSAPGVAGAKAALDADGNSIAVWSHYDGKRWRVQERRISATGSLGPVRAISGVADKPLWPQIASNPGGGAIVVWSRTRNRAEHPRGFDSRIEVRRISESGLLGPVKAVSARGRRAAGPRIASDASGDAIVAWQQRQQAILRIKARRISAKGFLGRVRTLSGARHKSEGPAVASDARGDAVVTWSQPDDSDWRIRARRISARGHLSSVKTLSASGHGAGLAEVASDAGGEAVVLWSQFNSQVSNRSIKARRISAKGAVGRVMTLSSPNDYGLLPQVASDARGDTVVVWEGDGAEARQISATGALGPTETLSSPGQTGYSPQVGIDAAGNATALWYETHYSPTAPESWYLLARQISANGALRPTQTLSTAPIRNTAVAVNAEGDAFAGWTQLDGSSWREWGSQGP